MIVHHRACDNSRWLIHVHRTPDMTERERMLWEIRRHPREDGPRAIFADMAEEGGDGERAHLIRSMLDMSRDVAAIRAVAREWFETVLLDDVGCELPGAVVLSWKLLGRVHGLNAFGMLLPHPRWGNNVVLLGVIESDNSELDRDERLLATLGYQRGFMRTVSCKGSFWATCGDHILQTCPVEEVTVDGKVYDIVVGNEVMNVTAKEWELMRQ